MNLPTAKTNWIDNTIEDYSEKAKLIAEYIPLRLYIFHICVLVIFYLLFMITGLIRDFPSSSNLLQWDTTWYQKIVLHGYVYKSHAQCSLAFFPLFPFFWAALHISTFGMSIINLIMMFAGLTLLTHCIHIPARTLLLILSTPSMFFCYVPYSEALFFFTSCLFLYGLKYDKLYMAITGMALASMTRSASTMFIPVIIISFLLNYRRATWQGDLKKMILLLITAIGAVILVCFIQYCQTGYWFKFFETQRYWGREFNIPGLFLTTWGEWSWTWLDGSAFFVCAVCFAGLVYLFLRKKRTTTKMIDPVFYSP